MIDGMPVTGPPIFGVPEGDRIVKINGEPYLGVRAPEGKNLGKALHHEAFASAEVFGLCTYFA